MNTRTIELNIAHASTRESLHEMIAAAFDFPLYYGRNWDAFMDSMGDSPVLGPDPCHVVFKGWNLLSARLGREAMLMRDCIKDLVALNPGFTVDWVDAQE